MACGSQNNIMPDQKPNLEPIEEGDLNLREKFSNEKELSPEKAENFPPKTASVEFAPRPEGSFEKKESQMEREQTYAKILAQSTNPTLSTDEDVSQDAELTMKEKDAESKVNNLVSLAETKGVAHAVKVARHMEDNYILDEFHDKLLSSELHDFLAKKGLIKET
jgi:hypothetical protein